MRRITRDAPLGHARTGLRCAERALNRAGDVSAGRTSSLKLPGWPFPFFNIIGKNRKPSWFGKDMVWEKSSLGPSAQRAAPAVPPELSPLS